MSATPPELRHLLTALVDVGEPVVVGRAGGFVSRVIPITGGTVHGEGVSGVVLPGGADTQLVGEQVSRLEARYVLELDGARVLVDNRAVRIASAEDSAAIARGEQVDPARVYFRCAPRLTADDDGPWGWVNDRIFVGTGRRLPDRVEIDVFEVL